MESEKINIEMFQNDEEIYVKKLCSLDSYNNNKNIKTKTFKKCTHIINQRRVKKISEHQDRILSSFNKLLNRPNFSLNPLLLLLYFEWSTFNDSESGD